MIHRPGGAVHAHRDVVPAIGRQRQGAVGLVVGVPRLIRELQQEPVALNDGEGVAAAIRAAVVDEGLDGLARARHAEPRGQREVPVAEVQVGRVGYLGVVARGEVNAIRQPSAGGRRDIRGLQTSVPPVTPGIGHLEIEEPVPGRLVPLSHHPVGNPDGDGLARQTGAPHGEQERRAPWHSHVLKHSQGDTGRAPANPEGEYATRLQSTSRTRKAPEVLLVST
jgi:hypothetical protein